VGSGENSSCSFLRGLSIGLPSILRICASRSGGKDFKNERFVSCSLASHYASLLIALDLKRSKLIPAAMSR